MSPAHCEACGAETPTVRLFVVMEENGITQVDLAGALGLHKTSVNKTFKALREGRRSSISLEQCETIAEHVTRRTGTPWSVDELFEEL